MCMSYLININDKLLLNILLCKFLLYFKHKNMLKHHDVKNTNNSIRTYKLEIKKYIYIYEHCVYVMKIVGEYT